VATVEAFVFVILSGIPPIKKCAAQRAAHEKCTTHVAPHNLIKLKKVS